MEFTRRLNALDEFVPQRAWSARGFVWFQQSPRPPPQEPLHAGPTRGRTHAPCSGNVGSSPLDPQGSPKRSLFCIFFLAPAVPFKWTVPGLLSPRTENEDAKISLQQSDAGSCFQCPIISHQHGGQDKVILFKGRGRRYHSHAILAGSKCGGRSGVGKSFVVGALCPLGGGRHPALCLHLAWQPFL